MTRTIVAAVLTALALAPPAAAQDRERMQREIEELRARLTKSDDQLLEMARRYDTEKRRLQLEKEELLKEVAALKRENALLKARLDATAATEKAKKGEKGQGEKGEKAKDAVLDERRLTLNFPGTPLSEVCSFIQDITALNVVLDANVPDDAEVTLRVRDLSLRKCLDLMTETCKTPDGKQVALKWRMKDGVVQIKAKK